MPAEAPTGLKAAGTRLWRDVQAGYELRLDEERLLDAACRTLDELDALESALREAPDALVDGSKGQPRPHPLFAEVRAHRLVLRQLLTGIGLEEGEADQRVGAARSHAGRQLARKRWERRGAAA